MSDPQLIERNFEKFWSQTPMFENFGAKLASLSTPERRKSSSASDDHNHQPSMVESFGAKLGLPTLDRKASAGSPAKPQGWSSKVPHSASPSKPQLPPHQGRRTSQAISRSSSVPEAATPPLTSKLRAKLEELEMCVSCAHEVNAHLNREVERLVLELDMVRDEKAAYERHTHELALLLTKERKKHAGGGTGQTDEDVYQEEVGRLSEPGSLFAMNGAASEPPSSTGFLPTERWQALRQLGLQAGWLVDPPEVRLGPVIGEGAFGVTHRGTWRGGETAVKIVRVSKQDEAESFLREVEMLSRLRHPNIMPFYGASLAPPEQCWLLCEFLPGGTLAEWCHGKRRADGRSAPRRSLAAKLEMALGVARGMQALEEAHPPILHRDLKPSNVFLDAGGHPRVADMGLARRIASGRDVLTGETGTYLYMSPEMIRHEHYDGKTDVFSWGVILAELLSQQTPYAHLFMTPVQVALAVGDDKLRPQLPAGTAPAVVQLAESCYDPDPYARPTFAMIVESLQLILSGVRAQQAQEAADASVLGRVGGFFKTGAWKGL